MKMSRTGEFSLIMCSLLMIIYVESRFVSNFHLGESINYLAN